MLPLPHVFIFTIILQLFSKSYRGGPIQYYFHKSIFDLLFAFVCLPQEREEAEDIWAADGQSVVKKDKEEGEGSAARNARSQAPKERSRGRGTVTGGRDEL